MPIYEYECKECGKVFSKLVSISTADNEIKCPVCGSDETSKKFSAFASPAALKSSGKSCGSGKFT